VYAPTQWYDIIEKSRVKKNKFESIKMEKNYFKNTAVIEENMVNRKKTDSEDKVEWLKIKEMRFKMEAPGLMEYKYTHNSLVSFDSVNLNKRLKGRPSNLGSLILTTLYPNGRKLSDEKLKDVKSLLQFMPPMFHTFYTNLEANTNEDVIEQIPMVINLMNTMKTEESK
jgi:hypothetical protein